MAAQIILCDGNNHGKSIQNIFILDIVLHIILIVCIIFTSGMGSLAYYFGGWLLFWIVCNLVFCIVLMIIMKQMQGNALNICLIIYTITRLIVYIFTLVISIIYLLLTLLWMIRYGFSEKHNRGNGWGRDKFRFFSLFNVLFLIIMIICAIIGLSYGVSVRIFKINFSCIRLQQGTERQQRLLVLNIAPMLKLVINKLMLLLVGQDRNAPVSVLTCFLRRNVITRFF